MLRWEREGEWIVADGAMTMDDRTALAVEMAGANGDVNLHLLLRDFFDIAAKMTWCGRYRFAQHRNDDRFYLLHLEAMDGFLITRTFDASKWWMDRLDGISAAILRLNVVAKEHALDVVKERG